MLTYLDSKHVLVSAVSRLKIKSWYQIIVNFNSRLKFPPMPFAFNISMCSVATNKINSWMNLQLKHSLKGSDIFRGSYPGHDEDSINSRVANIDCLYRFMSNLQQ
jgi:hypothetical protein